MNVCKPHKKFKKHQTLTSLEFPTNSEWRHNRLCLMELKFAKQTNIKRFTNQAVDSIEVILITA